VTDEPSPEIRDDLETLTARAKAADAAVTEYVERITAERKKAFPAPEQLLERATWPEAESAELSRLREAALAAWRPVWDLRREHGLSWK
jgi:hypothetical protein